MNWVFLHGLGQKPSCWEKTISMLPDGISSDCPDLYAIAEGGERNYENLYRAFSEYCNSVEDKLCLCGLSLGAVLALNYAEDFPHKVKGLVLIAPQYKMPKGLLKLQSAIFRLMPDKAFAETGLEKADFISLTSSMTELDFSGGISRVTCPALVCCGERDKANGKAAEKLSRILPDSEYVSIKNSGHEANIDNPAELAKILTKWIKTK